MNGGQIMELNTLTTHEWTVVGAVVAALWGITVFLISMWGRNVTAKLDEIANKMSQILERTAVSEARIIAVEERLDRTQTDVMKLSDKLDSHIQKQ